jgi:hypothetical protein
VAGLGCTSAHAAVPQYRQDAYSRYNPRAARYRGCPRHSRPRAAPHLYTTSWLSSWQAPHSSRCTATYTPLAGLKRCTAPPAGGRRREARQAGARHKTRSSPPAGGPTPHHQQQQPLEPLPPLRRLTGQAEQGRRVGVGHLELVVCGGADAQEVCDQQLQLVHAPGHGARLLGCQHHLQLLAARRQGRRGAGVAAVSSRAWARGPVGARSCRH